MFPHMEGANPLAPRGLAAESETQLRFAIRTVALPTRFFTDSLFHREGTTLVIRLLMAGVSGDLRNCTMKTCSPALGLACFLFIATARSAAAGAFLDEMLLKWVVVKYQMKEYAQAHDKCTQLIYEYPESPCALQGIAMLPRIQAALRKERGTFPAPPSSFVQPFQTNTLLWCSMDVNPSAVLTNLQNIASNLPAVYGRPVIEWNLPRTSGFNARYQRRGTDAGTGAPYELTLVVNVWLRETPTPQLVVSAPHATYAVAGWPVLIGRDAETELFQSITNQLRITIGRVQRKRP